MTGVQGNHSRAQVIIITKNALPVARFMSPDLSCIISQMSLGMFSDKIIRKHSNAYTWIEYEKKNEVVEITDIV